MNKRIRKKYLKKHGLYVNPRETWSLDVTIAKFIVPRLKLYKKLNNGYPGRDEMDTPEKWNEALDKMIKSFELSAKNYDGAYGLDMEQYLEKKVEIREAINEGLQLFAKWYEWLGW